MVKVKKKKEEEKKKPEAAPTPQPSQEVTRKVTQPEIIRDQETGKITGVTLPDGRTILGSGREVRGLVESYTQKRALPAGAVEATTAAEEREREQFIAEQEIPRARELKETTVGAFEEAQIGPKISEVNMIARTPLGQALIGKIGLDEIKKQGKEGLILKMTDYMLENDLTPEKVSSDPAIQMILSLKLNEKDIELLKSGEVDVSAIAQGVEGIPFISGAARKWAGGAITPTVPSQRIDDLNQKIVKAGNKIRDYRMAAARTPSNADKYLKLIEDTEREIRNAESRIKLLIIQSPIMQNSPEETEVIFEDIDRTLNRIGDARNAIYRGETIEEATMATQVLG